MVLTARPRLIGLPGLTCQDLLCAEAIQLALCVIESLAACQSPLPCQHHPRPCHPACFAAPLPVPYLPCSYLDQDALTIWPLTTPCSPANPSKAAARAQEQSEGRFVTLGQAVEGGIHAVSGSRVGMPCAKGLD